MRMTPLSDFCAKAGISEQAVRKASKHYGFRIVNSMIDADHVNVRGYLDNNGSQRRTAVRRKAEKAAELQRAAAPSEPTQPMADTLTGPELTVDFPAEMRAGEPLYPRSSVEAAIAAAWDKVIDYAYDMFVLPIACKMLAERVRKALSLKAAAKIIEQSAKDDLDEIGTYVDHGTVLIVDGPESAARWNDEHFPDDPAKEPEK